MAILHRTLRADGKYRVIESGPAGVFVALIDAAYNRHLPLFGNVQQRAQLVGAKLDSVFEQAPVQLLRQPPVAARLQPPYPGGVAGDEGFRKYNQPCSLVGGILYQLHRPCDGLFPVQKDRRFLNDGKLDHVVPLLQWCL